MARTNKLIQALREAAFRVCLATAVTVFPGVSETEE